MAPRCLALPDVFLDHLVFADDLYSFTRSVEGPGGVGRLQLRQELRLGGNAFNFGYHFSRLGGRTTLVSRTSSLILEMLRESVSGLEFDLRYVEEGFEPSLTVALEFEGKGSPRTLNINHPGSLAAYGPEFFPHELVGSRFDYVGLFNWTNNRRGSELFGYVCDAVEGVKLFDLASPQLRSDFPTVKSFVNRVDMVSGNESEIGYFARALGYTSADDPLRGAEEVSKTGIRVAMHGDTRSVECVGGESSSADVHRVPAKASTGCGDAWTAAYVYGLSSGLSGEKLLGYANKYVASTLTGSDTAPRDQGLMG